MKRQILVVLTTALTVFGCALDVAAQGLGVEIATARQKNAKLMEQYSWNTRLEVIDNGTVKDTRIDLVNYGPTGQIQRTLINDVGSPLPHGFLRRRLAEKERASMDKEITGILKFVDQYTLPTGLQLQAFIGTATIQPPGADGLLQLTGSSVIVPGDTVSMTVKATTRAVTSMSVMSTVDGDQVTANATFKTLSNGLNYMAFCTMNIPAKNLTIQVQNFDYVNQNQ